MNAGGWSLLEMAVLGVLGGGTATASLPRRFLALLLEVEVLDLSLLETFIFQKRQKILLLRLL